MGHPHPLLLWIGGLTILLIGVSVSLGIGERLGWVGYLLGFPAGILGFALAILVFATAHDILRQAGPALPPCHTGKCSGERWWKVWRSSDRGDYEVVEVDSDNGRHVHRCGCGREYQLLFEEDGRRRFMERLPDATLKPYMAHKPFRGWRPDAGEDE